MPKNRFCLAPNKDLLGLHGEFSHRPMNAVIVAVAKAKGFTAISRVTKNSYYALRCDRCGGLTAARHSVVRDSQPTCHACLADQHRSRAADLGLTLVARDDGKRQNAIYLLPCGHEGRRQMNLLRRVAAGETALRCDVCVIARQDAEAAARGWRLIGPDPSGKVSYRLYKHEGCGALQSVAIVNMKTGRFDCNACGQTWSAAPSALYAMRFVLADGEPVAKLGYSRDPVSRLNHQLLSGFSKTGEILRVVSMPSGAAAIRAEKEMHKTLRAELPGAVVPAHRIAGQIKVRSEIYAIEALPRILALLDSQAACIEAEAAA